MKKMGTIDRIRRGYGTKTKQLTSTAAFIMGAVAGHYFGLAVIAGFLAADIAFAYWIGG